MLRSLLLVAILGATPMLGLAAAPVLADSHTETANLRVDGMV